MADRSTSVRTATRNLVLLGRTAVRHAQDDPMLLAVQTLRRLPAPVRTRVASALLSGGSPTSVRHALAHFLADHPADARRSLAGAEPSSRVARRVGAEIDIVLGGTAPVDATPLLRARSAWARGEVSEAATVAATSPRRGGQRYAAVLASERDLLTPGFRLPARPARSVASGSELSGIRPLHLLINSLPWTQSGYSLRSHAILKAQAAAGMTVEAMTRIGYPVVVGLPHARDVDVVDGITYRRVVPRSLAATPAERLEQTVEAVVERGRKFGATVLHTTTHYPNALTAQAAAESLGVPWVYEVRGQLEKSWLARRPPEDQARAATSERYLLARARETEMALAADHVVTLSTALRDDLVAQGVPAERISLVPNAVDAALLDRSETPVEARAALGLPEDGFWVGSVSSIVDYEGFDVLVHAVALLRSEGLPVRLAIAGDGVARPGLSRLAERLGIADAVVLPGRVPPSEAVRWHQALDAFVVPRLDTEVCRTVTPLKPIEAMALGRPVVASDLPALAEVVESPGTGLVAPAGDASALAAALSRLAADADLVARLGAGGHRFARTRTWAAQAETYRAIYEGLGVARGS
ncbi:glycosyltransferase family 4 protein [Intrasporangium calvum]|uniref:Glycosyltransferase family 4 protein n=1 Tax=Intrasporangium calvum TaxID=53358 RepID=A0ABT5GJG8_9MICO|nr:glycosyltransferase family 4 protein [Intrasporangium calvum]MDC5698346.1 glycosyltransferase family 4 protein [Intrasporangium calvum]